MFHRTRKLAIAAAAALAVAHAGACWAQDEAPAAAAAATPAATGATQDVSAEIQALRAKLDKLEAQQAETRRLEEARRTTDQVIRDADRRSMLIDTGGFSGGYEDERFVIRSTDGNFSFKPWLHMQFRQVTMVRQDLKAGGRDETDIGYELRRVKFGFDGNMFGPDFTYLFNWATARANSNNNVTDAAGTKIGTVSNSIGGAPILEEAWVKYHFPNTPWSIKAGQIKNPLLHDQIVSSKYQVAQERSLVADVFANGDAFTQGVSLIWDPKQAVRAEFAVTQGLRSANTNFLDFPQTNAYNFGVAGRVEYKLMGNWKDYGQMSALKDKDPLLVIGVGGDYSERGHSGQTIGVVDAFYADPSGLSLYAALVDRYSNHNFGFQTQSGTGASIGTPDPAVADQSTNEYGIVLQGAYVLPGGHWEPFGRYEYMKVQGTPAGSHNYVQSITGGVNYYFYGHRAKLTAQVQYFPSGLPFDDSASDVLRNDGNGEISAGVQFQLLL